MGPKRFSPFAQRALSQCQTTVAVVAYNDHIDKHGTYHSDRCYDGS